MKEHCTDTPQTADTNNDVPRTIPQLINAIESLFVPRGDFGGKATMMVGDQLLRATTYATGFRKDEHDSVPLDAWHPSAEAAIAGHWAAMVKLHRGESVKSWGSYDTGCERETETAIAPRSIFWRKKPELVFADTGIVYVRMRCALV